MTTGRASPMVVGDETKPLGKEEMSETEQQIDEIAGYSVGNTLLLVAVTSALLDAGVLSEDGLARAVRAFADIAREDMDVMALVPFKQFAELLQGSAGPNGHVAAAEFSALSGFLESLRGRPSTGEDE
ncbi:MAG: hypothetical protein M0006_16050 [Magnetospirillum sp.]|nr:hypothetical protein [Magnetospirillum sp.]